MITCEVIEADSLQEALSISDRDLSEYNVEEITMDDLFDLMDRGLTEEQIFHNHGDKEHRINLYKDYTGPVLTTNSIDVL